ncbi:MAG: hypothetical protein EBV19_11080 [Flavobacteriia bacterium]|nr:hypothetical protein [Flavobacteriia bacterium]
MGQFWFEFRDDEKLKEFITYNDIGLPLAWFIATGVVTPNPMAEDYVNETFNLFLAALEVTEEEIEGIDTLDSLLAFVEIKVAEKE